MARAKTAWGIDIGNRALKAIKLVRSGDGLVVDDIDVIEHEQILSNAGDNRESFIQSAVANFVQRHPVKGIPIAVGVSGHASFARFIKLPPVEAKRIPEMIRFEAIQQIPFPLDEVEWSYQIFQTPDSPDVEVGIFAMRKDMVNRQINFFTSAGMSVQVVQTNPLAVYNAMYFDDRLKDGTTMIVDVGAENTDLIIADGDTVWLRTLPIGGNRFTETLAKSFKVGFAKAEELKRTAATSKFARQIFQAMRPIFADLKDEIQRSIGFYASVHSDSRIKKVYALGSTFRLPTLQKYLQQNLQLEVERLDGFSAGAPADGRAAALLNDNIISLVGPYGLALQAMGEGKIASSLLPEDIRRERVWKEKTLWFASAAALMLLGTASVGAKWYMLDSSYENTAPQRSNNDAAYSSAKSLADKWTKETAATEVTNTITAYDALGKYRDVWPKILDEIASKVAPANFNKQPDRSKREEIILESIKGIYYPDMEAVLDASGTEFRQMGSLLGGSGSSSGSGGEPRSSGPGNPGDKHLNKGKRGFMVLITCRSPNPSYVSERLVNRLVLLTEKVAANPDHPRPFYFARADIVNEKTYGSILIGGGTGGGGRSDYGVDASESAKWGEVNSTAAGAPPTTIPDERDPAKDAISGEDLSNDHFYTVLVAAVLDPAAEAAQPAKAGGK